jgi:hypothetical protein
VLALGVLAACGGSAARQDAERRSYEATAHYVIDAWREGKLPARYTADTLRTIAEQLGDRGMSAAADAVERGDPRAAGAPG